MQQQEFSETKNRISLFESEFEDGWLLQKLMKENSPSFPKRRRLEDDAQSCISSRTDSPVSVDSFMDESFCPTPTDSPSTRVATLSDFKKHYKKDELWAAIESNYQYLMDDEIIETCRVSKSQLLRMKYIFTFSFISFIHSSNRLVTKFFKTSFYCLMLFLLFTLSCFSSRDFFEYLFLFHQSMNDINMECKYHTNFTLSQ